LHRRGIIHRDLKPENLILSEDRKQLKIADLGVVNTLNGETTTRSTIAGSIPFMAPEMLNRAQYNRSIDMWSIGVILYEMLTGVLPFDKQPRGDDVVTFPPEANISHEAKVLIRHLLQVDPAKWPSIVEAIEHPFLKKHGVDMLKI
jgi:serine/threonine protein kinase